jgi:hypothetical protein
LIALALTGFKLPLIINAPLTLVGGIRAGMLLAYGISSGLTAARVRRATIQIIRWCRSSSFSRLRPISSGRTPWAWSVAICSP